MIETSVVEEVEKKQLVEVGVLKEEKEGPFVMMAVIMMRMEKELTAAQTLVRGMLLVEKVTAKTVVVVRKEKEVLIFVMLVTGTRCAWSPSRVRPSCGTK